MIGAVLSLMIVAANVQTVAETWQETTGLRIQRIQKVTGEKEWPFYAEAGRLFCIPMLGRPYVYFLPDGKYDHRRLFLLDTDMFQMTLVNFGMTDVMLPASQPAEIVKRIAPFVAMGHMLCKQKSGSNLPSGEL
jgi:hypothetical protein